MARYITRRVLQMVPVFFGATLLVFVALFVFPGDPALVIGGERARDPASYRYVREKYHLDEPVHVQYAVYMKGIFQGDLGTSFHLRRPVT
ncbi:MAG: ABC transporter permease, partial [Actinomycetota bacterium]